MKSKICGISDSKTLKYLTNHSNPPDFIGFIVNYPKSKRYIEANKLIDQSRWDDYGKKCLEEINTNSQNFLIENVDSFLLETKRLLKSGGKLVNVSVLWDHFKFHGPENELNTLIHDAFRAHCFHQMLPMEMKSKLQNLGFYNIKNKELAFLITERNNNSPAKFTEETIAKFALKEGVSEDKVLDWRNQLALAEEQGHFGFTSFPVLTEALL